MSAARVAVTVSSKRAGRLAGEARAAAARWGLPYYERPHRSGLDAPLGEVAEAFLVLGGDGWTLQDGGGRLRFSPGMGLLRVKRLDRGQGADDVLVRLGELRAGDVVVDATLGLAADATVCARVVGPRGRVLGLEKSVALAALVGEGLRRAPLPPGCAEIEVRCADGLEALGAMAAGSADVVVLDPMFERPKRAAPAFEVLRRHACHAPVTVELLEAARRVARRWVLVKCGRYGKELRRLGLEQEPATRSATVVWARVKGQG